MHEEKSWLNVLAPCLMEAAWRVPCACHDGVVAVTVLLPAIIDITLLAMPQRYSYLSGTLFVADKLFSAHVPSTPGIRTLDSRQFDAAETV
jgi:hypothetical protein